MSQNGMENSNVFIRRSEVKIILINLDNYVYNLKTIDLNISLLTFAKYLPYYGSLFNTILQQS